jgi:hypothetical protein
MSKICCYIACLELYAEVANSRNISREMKKSECTRFLAPQTQTCKTNNFISSSILINFLLTMIRSSEEMKGEFINVNISATVILNQAFPISLEELGTLTSGAVLSENIINIVFCMLQQKFKSCLFLNKIFSDKIYSKTASVLITNIFLRSIIFFPINIDDTWLLGFADMKRKVINFIGLKLTDRDLSDVSNCVFEWFSESSGDKNDFDISQWKSFNLIQTLSPPNTCADSGVYLLLCAHCLAAKGTYPQYDGEEVEFFRTVLKVGIENSKLPNLPLSGKDQIKPALMEGLFLLQNSY